MKPMASIAIALIVAYVTILLLMFLLQRSLQYFPDRARVQPGQVGLSGVQEVELTAADGTRLIGWHAPAREGMATVLFFHGNGGAIAGRADRFAAYRKEGFGVFFASYRGYGGSGGKPTEAGLTADAMVFMDWLAARGVAGLDIVLVGESLGSAVAISLAAKRPVAAVILEAPFSSAVDIAAAHYWWLPVRALMRDRYDAASVIGAVTAPITIIHGDRDRIVPLEYGRKLFAAAREPKEMIVIAGAGHNDLLRPQVLAKEIQLIRDAGRK